jgi:hypothetical protein
MKRVIGVALTGLFLLGNVPAHASEERGAWVAVDANGNAVSQAIVCTPSVCGNKDNPFMGQNWVLQAPASPDGNVAGVGANQGIDVVKVNLETRVWNLQDTSVYHDPITKEEIKTITIQQFTSDQAPWVTHIPVTTTVITTPIITAQEQKITQMYQQLEKLRVGLKAKKKKGRR